MTSATESEILLTEWLQDYINKLAQIDDDMFKYHDDWDSWCVAKRAVPRKVSNRLGELNSALANVEVTKGWKILMRVTGQSRDLFNRKRRDVLHEAIRENHKNITDTILEYLTPDKLLQFLQFENDRGEKYLYSTGLPYKSSLLTELLYRLPEVSQRYELLNIRDQLGNTVLHTAQNGLNIYLEKKLHALETEDWCYQLLTAKNNKGQTLLYVWSSNLKTALDPLNAVRRMTMINMRDNEGKTAAEHLISMISDGQNEFLESRWKARLAGIENRRCEARIEISMCIQDETARDDILRQIIQEESLTQDEIQQLSPLTSQYIIPHQQRLERLNSIDDSYVDIQEVASLNLKRERQTSRYGLIFYNTEQRENGAEDEARNLEEALSHTGCDVIKVKWGHTDELRQIISDRLVDVGGRCNFLFVCIMSHGELGQLRGSDDSLVSISTIIRDFEQNLPSHVPLVLMVQACQNSEVGAFSATAADMPAVHTLSNSTDDKHIVLTRDNTVLILASKPGGIAYRGAYTGELANQIRQANGYISLHDMHSEAVIGLRRSYGSEQTPVYTDTLDKRLLMPGNA